MDPFLEWLDSQAADQGLTPLTKQKLHSVLSVDDGYQRFSDLILKPPTKSTVSEEVWVKRSWRALQILSQELSAVGETGGSWLVDSTQAALLAKEIFASLDKHHNNNNDDDDNDDSRAKESPSRLTSRLLHTRSLLEKLLEAYPSSVVAAACAGGMTGMEAHLRPLLSPATSSQTLPTVTRLVLYGCTGKPGRASAELTVAEQQKQQLLEMQQRNPVISQGHRRKFVKSLTEWGFLSRMVDCIEEQDANPSVGEDVCETILTIVECIGYPQEARTQKNESLVREDTLLAPLGKPDWWDLLVDKLGAEATKVAVTRVMMGIFTLATGRSSRIRKSNAPMTDASEAGLASDQTAAKTEEQLKNQNNAAEHKNKLREWGLTTKIHESLVAHLPQLVQSLGISEAIGEEESQPATTYFERGVDDGIQERGVPHPGRFRIVPFTSWRLHVVTLLAEILTWQEDDDASPTAGQNSGDGAVVSLRNKAMTVVMDELALPPLEHTSDAVMNPWPFLCDWVFEYPENSLYHYQFIRMIRAICMENHDKTLRLVLQKLKFVSRAVKTCQQRGSLRGVLITCLNILRLRSQSLPPSAFLRQFLESHDAWKGFQDKLQEMTLDQIRPIHPAPGKEVVSSQSTSIDLGSSFASQLGFERVEADTSVALKKKPNKKRKKKKKSGTSDNKEIDDASDVSSLTSIQSSI